MPVGKRKGPWTKENRKKPLGAKCEAKTVKGRLCPRLAMPNGRCKLHGGMSTGKKTPIDIKGEKNPMFKFGLYDTGLHEGEKELYQHVKIGNLADEIKMLKIRLRRAWNAQKDWEENRKKSNKGITDSQLGKTSDASENFYDVDVLEDQSGGGYIDRDGVFHETRTRKITRRKNDYMVDIEKLNKMIGVLEEKHRALLEEGLGSEELLQRLVDSFRDFSTDAAATLPGGKM